MSHKYMAHFLLILSNDDELACWQYIIVFFSYVSCVGLGKAFKVPVLLAVAMVVHILL